jgi:DNA-binding response OmpR family regulator
MARILVIDDDPDILTLHTLMLKDEGHTVHAVRESDTFLEAIRVFQPDLIILDILMPGVSGGTIYHAVRDKVGLDLPIIISSGSKMSIPNKDDPKLAHCSKPADYAHLRMQIKHLVP